MKPSPWRRSAVLLLLTHLTPIVLGTASDTAPASQNFSEYFSAEAGMLEEQCLSGINSLEDWTSQRETLRRQLREMLGIEPLPPRTDLRPVTTGRIDQEDFVVEKIYFQASPQLYVTANLYLPRNLSRPAPAILYACGHARMVTNGISSGNKSWYQHHGAWFARNGYVCLLIDTLQLGEIEGMHHGTYREGQWWWNSRGYTPAGVEAWFGIRALDYLCSRPEVDRDRIGMTGRSGGGSYTWTVAALDDRVKVAAPVAGITDLRNQVVSGAVEGHCDCMFFVNTYRWDFPQLAALIAPRPLLIANSDKDRIFPLDGVERLHKKVSRIYDLYGADNKLGLLITEGPHSDTQDLQLPVFRWFNRFLKQEDPLIAMAAEKFIEPARLRVFDQLPSDQLNTCIQEQFVPAARHASPGTPDAVHGDFGGTLKSLRAKVFAGWPEEEFSLEPSLWAEQKAKGVRYRFYEFDTQPGINLNLYIVSPARPAKPDKVVLTILDARTWTNSPARGLWSGTRAAELAAELREQIENSKVALAFFAPRGVATTYTNKAKFPQIRRRYMLLGQTLDGMRVWDIRCAIQAVHSLPQFGKAKITLSSAGEMGINAAYAALFQPEVSALELDSLPASHMQGPDYLNVLKVWDIPEMLAALGSKAELHINRP